MEVRKSGSLFTSDLAGFRTFHYPSYPVFMKNSLEHLAGKIIKYYGTIGVASIEVFDRLATGDTIHIKGQTTDFDQRIASMEIDHRRVTSAAKGQRAGIKVSDYVRKNDLVYRVEES